MASLPEAGEVLDGFGSSAKLHAGGMGRPAHASRRAQDPGFPLVMKVPRLGSGEPAEAVVTYEVEQIVMSVLQGPARPALRRRRRPGRPALPRRWSTSRGESLKEWVASGPAPGGGGGPAGRRGGHARVTPSTSRRWCTST